MLQCGNKVYMALEYVACGDLLVHVQKQGAASEAATHRWFLQLLSAIHYMHSMGVAHRDLKLENILIDTAQNLKIADFGFCRSVPYHPLPSIFTKKNGNDRI